MRKRAPQATAERPASTSKLTDPIPTRYFKEDMKIVKEMAEHHFVTDSAAIRWLVHNSIPAGKKQFCANGKQKATA